MADQDQLEVSLAIIDEDLRLLETLNDSVFIESVDFDVLAGMPNPVFEVELQSEFQNSADQYVYHPPVNTEVPQSLHLMQPPLPLTDVMTDVEATAMQPPPQHIMQHDVMQPLPPTDVVMTDVEAITMQPPPTDVVMQPGVMQPSTTHGPGPSSGVRARSPPPRAHNFYSSFDSDIMVDQYGMEIPSTRRTRSQTLSSVSSSTSSVATARHKYECNVCGRKYVKSYLPKHKCRPT